MTKNTKKPLISPALLIPIAIIIFGLFIAFLIRDADLALLNPKGFIANHQSWLLITSTLIMLGFAIPVIATLYFFIWKYRDGAQNTSYSPHVNRSKAMLTFAWGGPAIIVAILAYLMLPATQFLAPTKPIASDNETLTVQVVSMDWKWLFIYPEHDIATVNFVQIPVDTPVRFELTADNAPMSSFWIPHLGGMLYSMTGHVNPINLMGDTIGDYPGASAEINGAGFAGMKFIARVSSENDFNTWVADTKASPLELNDAEYEKLLVPSKDHEQTFYARPSRNLFNSIVSKYTNNHGTHGEHEMQGSY